MRKLLLAALLFLPSCVPVGVYRSYVVADRMSYDAQAKDYMDYVDNDPNKDQATKDAIRGRLIYEGIGISKAEEYLGLPVQPPRITSK